MKKIATPLMLAMSLAIAGNAFAQAAPAAPESTLSFNVGGVVFFADFANLIRIG